MSAVEVYNPKFDDFHGKPMVTWQGGKRPVTVDLNLYDQYMRWKNTKLPKDEPPAMFWQSGGPAIVRALSFCGAKALTIEYATDRRISYQWFAPAIRAYAGNSDWYHVCSVYAEGVTLGSDTRVHVILPSDEEVVFMFRWSCLKDWYPVDPVLHHAPEPPESPTKEEPSR